VCSGTEVDEGVLCSCTDNKVVSFTKESTGKWSGLCAADTNLKY